MLIPSPESISESIPKPESDSVTIWRYMDFTKFVAMLETQSLFFTRIASLDDPFEGSFPKSQQPMDRILQMLPAEVVSGLTNVSVISSPGFQDFWKITRTWAMVNCWHAVEHESAAMWKLYAPDGRGIAIRSTVGQLREALGAPQEIDGFFGGKHFDIGMIQYIDYSVSTIPLDNGAAQFFRKRRSFEHERELRALFIHYPRSTTQWFDYSRRPTDKGRPFPVDLKKLCSEIRVAPQAETWYSELVTKVTARYGLGLQPQQSELDGEPLY